MGLFDHPWRGITIDDVTELDVVLANVIPMGSDGLIFRLVCDPERPLSYYDSAVERISSKYALMVQVRDSYEEKRKPLSVDAYRALFLAMLTRWQSKVAIWEIGNEVNGNWLPGDIGEKVVRCWVEAQKQGVLTAVTFYLEAKYAMGLWAHKHNIRCDVALISWYPRSNVGFVPDWNAESASLSLACGNAYTGIGEFGGEDDDGTLPPVPILVRLINAMNGLRVLTPKWLGGGFYWDACRMGKTLWAVFKTSFRP